MLRSEVVEVFARHRRDALVITGPGATSGALWDAGHQPGTIYNMEMGYATAMCLGVALARPDRRVVAMEGEGSTIAGMAVFATIARYRPANLTVLVFDNGVYGTGGAEVETATAHGVDLSALALACGLDPSRVAPLEDLEAVEQTIPRALVEPGPWILLARVQATDTRSGARAVPSLDHVETAYTFRHAATGGSA